MTGAQFRELKKHRSLKPQLNGFAEWVIGCSCGAISKSFDRVNAHRDFAAHQRTMLNKLEAK